MQYKALILCALIAPSIAFGDAPQNLESIVYSALADYQASQEAITRDGFACMARGLKTESPSTRTNTDGVIIPALSITCKRREFTTYAMSYHTSANTFARNPRGELFPAVVPRTTWQYEIFDGNRVKLSTGLEAPVIESTRAKLVKQRTSMVKKHDPFHDYLFPTRIDSVRLPADETQDFIAKATLTSVKELGSGKIEATFEIWHPQRSHKYEIVFSRAHGGMPVEVHITVQNSEVAFDKHYFCNGRYTWQKQQGIWLPSRIEFSRPVTNGSIWESDLVLDWKIGNQVPEGCFRFDNPDPLSTLGEMFGFDFDTYSGNRILSRAKNNWALPKEFDQ
ncbi:hypothetical protein [Stieleria mannarensis]|uniref:hypothetical protein n=1 Tax=Stieleria mannarensis TaxID=2755585 RepID=UPI0016043FE6|nr:hypothetical protein [Rhodopirellula sp. JC639]